MEGLRVLVIGAGGMTGRTMVDQPAQDEHVGGRTVALPSLIDIAASAMPAGVEDQAWAGEAWADEAWAGEAWAADLSAPEAATHMVAGRPWPRIGTLRFALKSVHLGHASFYADTMGVLR